MTTTNNQEQFVRKTTLLLSIALAFLLGGIIGYVIGNASSAGTTAATKREFTGNSPVAANMNQDMVREILGTEEQLAKDPNNAALWQRLGDLYYDTGEAKKSIDAYEKSLAINPDNPNALVDCGVMYRENHEHEKSLEMFNKALAIDPKHEVAYFNSGVVLINDLDRPEDGLAAWKKLLEINPNAKTPAGTPLADLIKDFSSR